MTFGFADLVAIGGAATQVSLLITAPPWRGMRPPHVAREKREKEPQKCHHLPCSALGQRCISSPDSPGELQPWPTVWRGEAASQGAP